MQGVTLDCDGSKYEFLLCPRDGKVAAGRQFPYSKALVSLLAAQCRAASKDGTVDRLSLLVAAKNAQSELESSGGLELYDYSFRIPPAHSWQGRGQGGLKVGGASGAIWSGPGMLFVEVKSESAGSLVLDLRGRSEFTTDDGVKIELRRKRRTSALSQVVSGLVEYLRKCTGGVLSARFSKNVERET